MPGKILETIARVVLFAGLAPVPLSAWAQTPGCKAGGLSNGIYTMPHNGNDRFYYTGATAITRSWAAAAHCDTAGKEVAFKRADTPADCRTYCPATQSRWPAVLDCRAKMGQTTACRGPGS